MQKMHVSYYTVLLAVGTYLDLRFVYRELNSLRHTYIITFITNINKLDVK